LNCFARSAAWALGVAVVLVWPRQGHAAIVVFEAAGADPASIAPARDAFREAVGGGTGAGANGSFGDVRREINWDNVPAASADPNLLAADFFNVMSQRGVVLGTPGTGFLVSANAGGPTPTLFGFPNDLQTFSPQKLFTAVNSNVTDVNFFVPGTTTPATTNAFGVIFTDLEVAGATKVEFFDPANALIFSRDGLAAGNQGLTFVGGVANAGERIGRVRITSGLNTIVSNGVQGNQVDDLVVMDDFLYGEPVAVPEPGAAASIALALCGLLRRTRKPGRSAS
jgi:hypothetical protein